MKDFIVIAVVAALVMAVAPCLAQDSPCNPSGAWYENGGPPYLLKVVPLEGPSRFSLTFEGTYTPQSLGASVSRELTTMTHWSGEMSKGERGYDAAAIAFFGAGESYPHRPVETWGVAGIAKLGDDCNTLHFTWFDGVKAWQWGDSLPPPVPFVDEVSHYPLQKRDLEETYFRMSLPRN